MHTKQELRESDPSQSPALPQMNLAGLVKHFGPGMILMMTGIGTSHLITAPVAGGRFAFDLLWCIPVGNRPKKAATMSQEPAGVSKEKKFAREARGAGLTR